MSFLRQGPGRPTTAPTAFDLSRGTAGTSGVPASPASMAAEAYYAPKRRTEDCACGGQITAETGWEAAAVDEHNRGLQHAAWRAFREACE